MLKQAQHDDSFARLFNDNYAKLCHFARQFMSDDDDAKDIVQEAFVVLLEC
ncbi:sigma factor [Pedobacter sp. MC2016-14]|uniref:sigma factor n=1 Tax=Pedobacter sp. MC2016-14 TaxID=2897327 RepID=UPI00351D0B3C